MGTEEGKVIAKYRANQKGRVHHRSIKGTLRHYDATHGENRGQINLGSSIFTESHLPVSLGSFQVVLLPFRKSQPLAYTSDILDYLLLPLFL